MRRFLLSTAAFAALAGSAIAADLPSRTTPLAPAPVVFSAPVSTWTGFYIGGFAGGDLGFTSEREPGSSDHYGVKTRGFSTGGFVGFNQQVDKFVLGVEGEYGFDNRSGNRNFVSTSAAAPFYTSTRSDQEGRIRARGGYAFNDFLVFGAGGLSLGGDKAILDGKTPYTSAEIGRFLVGYNLGAGVEYAVTKSISVRGEYIYDSFGRNSYAFSKTASSALGDRRIGIEDQTVRLGVSYKLPPVDLFGF